jgi:hypothetical protein
MNNTGQLLSPRSRNRKKLAASATRQASSRAQRPSAAREGGWSKAPVPVGCGYAASPKPGCMAVSPESGSGRGFRYHAIATIEPGALRLRSRGAVLRAALRRINGSTPATALIVNRQSTINNQQSTIDNRQSTIDNRQSTIDNRQSTIDNRQSAIDNRQSAHRAMRSGFSRENGTGARFFP